MFPTTSYVALFATGMLTGIANPKTRRWVGLHADGDLCTVRDRCWSGHADDVPGLREARWRLHGVLYAGNEGHEGRVHEGHKPEYVRISGRVTGN